jgi:hypothetical protein
MSDAPAPAGINDGLAAIWLAIGREQARFSGPHVLPAGIPCYWPTEAGGESCSMLYHADNKQAILARTKASLH